MNTKKLKLISLLEETNKSVRDNGSSILVEGLIPSEAEKIRQSFYKDGLDITPQEDGSFEFSFNTTESGSDDDIYNMFRDNDYDLEADYDEEDAILNANDECNGEICSSENSDDISGILSVCTDYQVEPECIDLYSDDADKLVDYSINYDVCPEEVCGAENSVENTEELEQPVAVQKYEQDYYFVNDFSGIDAGVIGFEENPEADMGIINLADDHSAEDYDEEAIDPTLIDNIEKENNRDIKDYLTVESVEEDEKLSDENIEPALKKLLIHNKEVLFGADSKKLSDYKAKIEKLDIEKLKDFADEDMPTWRKHIEKYIDSEKLNESFAHAVMDTPAWRRRKVYPNDIYVISRDIWSIVAHRTPHIDFASDDEPKLSEIDGGYKIQYRFKEPNQEMIEQLSMDIKHFLDGDKTQSENSTCYLGKSFNVLTRANRILTIIITLDDKKTLDESSNKTIYKIGVDGKYLKKTFTDHDKAYDYACEYLSKHEKDNIDHVAVEEFVNGEYNDDIVVMFKEPELNENKKINEAFQVGDRVRIDSYNQYDEKAPELDGKIGVITKRITHPHIEAKYEVEFDEGDYTARASQLKKVTEKDLDESVKLNEAAWEDFDVFSDRLEKYLPSSGEGETKASQFATAISKLVYKWFNDGDVYDNNYGMEGFANDISSYANWIYKYIDGGEILKRIEKIGNDESRYENILLDLCSLTCTENKLEKLAQEPKEGSVYECNGPFSMSKEDEWGEWDESVETVNLDESTPFPVRSPKQSELESVKEYIIDHFGDNMEFDTIETNKIYFNHVSYNTNQFSIEKMEEMLMDNFKGYNFEIIKDGEIDGQGEVLHVVVDIFDPKGGKDDDNLDESYNGDINSIRAEYYETENRDAAISDLLDIGEAENEEEAGDIIDDWDEDEDEWREANGYSEDLDEAKDENTYDDIYVVRWYGDKGSFDEDESYTNFDDAKAAADKYTDATGYAQVYNSDDKELKNCLYDTYEDMLSKQDEEDNETDDLLRYLKNEEDYEEKIDDDKELLTEFEGEKVIQDLNTGNYLIDYYEELWTPSQDEASRFDSVEARDTFGALIEDGYDFDNIKIIDL